MKLLMIPMYSMRSYDTNLYQLLYDSNTNIALHRAFTMPKDVMITLCVPTNVELSQLMEVLYIINDLKLNVKIMFVDYGVNAEETREVINYRLGHIDFDNFDLVEYQIETIEPKSSVGKNEYMIFYSASIVERRPTVEKYYFDLLERLKDGYTVYVSTIGQKELIPIQLQFEVTVKTKFFSTTFADYMMDKYYSKEVEEALVDIVNCEGVFFPFRLSDHHYRFEDVLSTLGENEKVFITDPNESSDKYTSDNIVNVGKLLYKYNKKTIYLTFLKFIAESRQNITIPLYEDIEENYHIGILEMLHHCPNNIDFKYGVDNAYRSDYIKNLKVKYFL